MKSNKGPSGRSARPQSERGVAAVEFALLITVFLTFVFSLIELSRAMYLLNTVHEVTRHAAAAAANASFSDGGVRQAIRQAAVFRGSPGELPLGAPVTDGHVRIDYLALVRDNAGNLTFTEIATGSLPESPVRNRHICLNNPNAANCIRLVRARICVPQVTDSCERPQYQMLFPFIQLPFRLPNATTIVSAESLGFVTGDAIPR